MVDDMSAPSNERLRFLTLSISRLISITFLVDIDLLVLEGCSIVFSRRAKLYFFDCYCCIVFLTVDLVEVYINGFFLKSILFSLLFAEYLVFMYFVSLLPEIWMDFFYEYFELKVFFFWSEDCGVYSFKTLSSCFS